jgi:hypothetical protein
VIDNTTPNYSVCDTLLNSGYYTHHIMAMVRSSSATNVVLLVVFGKLLPRYMGYIFLLFQGYSTMMF